jgi:hypothetical protein
MKASGAAAFVLAVASGACRYSDVGVGKAEDMTPEQALAYEEDQTGGVLPSPLEEHVGTGRAVQPDRMVTADLAFSKADGSPAGSGRVRFLHSAGTAPGTYTFGYVSPALVGAMAGMREGGSRRVQVTDSSCLDTSSVQQGYQTQNCNALGNTYEAAPSGSIFYPRGTPLLVSISILRVCRPTIIQEDLPDLIGGGPGRKLREVSCR